MSLYRIVFEDLRSYGVGAVKYFEIFIRVAEGPEQVPPAAASVHGLGDSAGKHHAVGKRTLTRSSAFYVTRKL